MTNRKYRSRSGRQPRLQASPHSMRKSVPGGEESGVVVLALVVPPSPMAVLLPKKGARQQNSDVIGRVFSSVWHITHLSNVRIVTGVLWRGWKRRAKDSVFVRVGSMASMIVLNSKSRCSVSGFCQSKAVAIAVATGATVFEVDLVLGLDFVVAFKLWWWRLGAASQASHLCAGM